MSEIGGSQDGLAFLSPDLDGPGTVLLEHLGELAETAKPLPSFRWRVMDPVRVTHDEPDR